MKLNWNFLGGGGLQNKKPSMGGIWIFSGTAQSQENHSVNSTCFEPGVAANLIYNIQYHFRSVKIKVS